MAVIAGPTREAIRHGHQSPRRMSVRTDLPAKTMSTAHWVAPTRSANFGSWRFSSTDQINSTIDPALSTLSHPSKFDVPRISLYRGACSMRLPEPKGNLMRISWPHNMPAFHLDGGYRVGASASHSNYSLNIVHEDSDYVILGCNRASVKRSYVIEFAPELVNA